jgi:YesN/AraC family two-component response regulator
MLKILLVDDELLTRKTLEAYLSRKGYDVISAEDGHHATRLLKKYTPDIVITDIIMPEINGIELILDIQKKYPSIKIIAISGGCKINASTHLNIAKDLGVQAILTKPVTDVELEEAITKCRQELY